ncbi:Transcriptional regulator, TetR family [Pseudonocardia sp. Ae717_Ps2]|nr:Transcriptional regulator, TetR family [Pseudonocardia sp. Ae331_Ps2]OLM11857.1 Transcriptional regulator, TetR family [Pseudonocardia sp. Ae505_Ps2]OLM29247.1 Transcriptional regulator, TetR family [Pseudonocardia sp. Ae717_Ps2]
MRPRMPDPAGPDTPGGDGRRRRGDRRRRELVEATLRLVGAGGVAAVSQRAVAAEAGVPPSAVFYYHPSVDALLVATLTAVNDRWIARLDAVTTPDDLVALVEDCARQERVTAIAEYELFLLAARRPDLRGELDRWDAALDAAAARLLPDDADRRALLAAAVNGLTLGGALGSPVDAGLLARLCAAGTA